MRFTTNRVCVKSEQIFLKFASFLILF